jgi:hypothetical protein
LKLVFLELLFKNPASLPAWEIWLLVGVASSRQDCLSPPRGRLPTTTVLFPPHPDLADAQLRRDRILKPPELSWLGVAQARLL